MQLQFAMDTLTTDDALRLAKAAAPHVDILELGTPLVKSEGFAAITAVKEAHPDKTVLADLKTMDAGELEGRRGLQGRRRSGDGAGRGRGQHHQRCRGGRA
jgi:3-keto-L-gulonate-6-phosphate decarboxylase